MQLHRQAHNSSRARRRLWLRWGLVAILLASCAIFVDFRDVLLVLGNVAPLWLIALIGVMTLDRLIMPAKWAILLKAQGVRIPMGALIRYYYQGTLTGILVPSSLGGDILRTHWVAEHAGATAECYAALIMERAIGLLSAVAWAVAGAAGLFLLSGGHAPWLWVVLVGLIGALFLALFLLSVHSGFHSLLRQRLVAAREGRIITFLRRLGAAYALFGKRRRALLWNALATLSEHGLQLLAFFMAATSLGIDLPTLPFLCVTAVHLLVMRLPVAPDGWGVAELSAIGLYGLIGVSAEHAFALMFLVHSLQLLVALPGLWFLITARDKHKGAAQGLSSAVPSRES